MHEIEINKAIDNYIQMEHDANIIDMLRKGTISGILREGTGWRVFADNTFVYAPTLNGALKEALK